MLLLKNYSNHLCSWPKGIGSICSPIILPGKNTKVFEVIMTVCFAISQNLRIEKSLFVPVEYLYGVTMREKKYEKPPLSDRQLAIFKKHHQMDYYLYDLSLKKFDRQVAEFGRDRMEAEVQKLKLYAQKCQTNSQSCMKSKFTTVRDSPKQKEIMKMTEFKGERIKNKIDRDYGKSI